MNKLDPTIISFPMLAFMVRLLLLSMSALNTIASPGTKPDLSWTFMVPVIGSDSQHQQHIVLLLVNSRGSWNKRIKNIHVYPHVHITSFLGFQLHIFYFAMCKTKKVLQVAGVGIRRRVTRRLIWNQAACNSNGRC